MKSENKYLLVILMDKIPHYKFSVEAKSLNTVYLILENQMDNAIYLFAISNSGFLLEDMVAFRYPL